jgi:hypothetical protein
LGRAGSAKRETLRRLPGVSTTRLAVASRGHASSLPDGRSRGGSRSRALRLARRLPREARLGSRLAVSCWDESAC